MAKQFLKTSSCLNYNLLVSELDTTAPYFEHLSKEDSTVPSESLAPFVCKGFALLDYLEHSCVRAVAMKFLNYHLCDNMLACTVHCRVSINSCIKIIVNSFYNNKQKLANDTIVKDETIDFKKIQRAKE